jgi:cation diffusion facilitator CzcD-associated flavoprotein CzcO
VATNHNLHPHFRFQTEVISASWVEEKSQWKLLLSNKKKGEEQKGQDEEVFVDFLISGVGQLSRPFYPTSKQIPGIEKFRGKMMHSARWDTTYDVAGKDVAIIGTGAR